MKGSCEVSSLFEFILDLFPTYVLDLLKWCGKSHREGFKPAHVTPDLSDLAFKTFIKTENLNEKKQNIKEIINGIHQT